MSKILGHTFKLPVARCPGSLPLDLTDFITFVCPGRLVVELRCAEQNDV